MPETPYPIHALSASAIIQVLEGRLSQRVRRRVIRLLEAMWETRLSGNSALNSARDEARVQLPSTRPILRSEYDGQIRALVAAKLARLAAVEREAFWQRPESGESRSTQYEPEREHASAISDLHKRAAE